MTGSTAPAANNERSSRYPIDPVFYYRIDRTANLQRLSRETDFKAVRWDRSPYRWPHSALSDANKRRPQEHGIFRICFWINEAEGREALAMNFADPQTLLRVKRKVVSESLPGWNFDVDDALEAQADMIWTVGPLEGEHTEFSPQGIPLAEFEAWCDRRSKWVSMREADGLLPDRIQMAKIGWQTAFVHSSRSGSLVCHWQVLPMPQGRVAGFVVLTSVDADCHANLGGDDLCVSGLVDHLLKGPLAMIRQDVVGLITVCVTDDRLWIEQFGVRDASPVHRTWFSRRSALESEALFLAVRRAIVKPDECYRLIEQSGLRLAKIARACAWQYRG